MASLTLVIGNKNYSSWSLRGWLALCHTGADFTEVLIPLDHADTAERISQYSPAGRVPTLVDGDITVWDSLAIIEYLAERFPDAGLWPADPAARAVARAVSAEMHSGFMALRNMMPMNIRKSLPGRGHTAEALADVERVQNLWRDCHQRFGGDGDYLFGAFSAADIMYAPVVSRFITYGVAMDSICQAYADAIMAHPAMQRWCAAAQAETWVIPHEELD